MYKKLTKKQRFLAITILAAVLALLSGWYFTLRKGVYIGEEFYYKVSDTKYAHNMIYTIERTSDTEFTITSGSEKQTVSFQKDGSRMTFTFPDGESLTGTWDGTDLIGGKGFPLGSDDYNIRTGDDPSKPDNSAYARALSRICFGKSETISEWFLMFLGILIYALGIVSILRPDDTYFFLMRWKYNNPELSDAGRMVEQISGAVIAVTGLAIMSGLPFLL